MQNLTSSFNNAQVIANFVKCAKLLGRRRRRINRISILLDKPKVIKYFFAILLYINVPDVLVEIPGFYQVPELKYWVEYLVEKLSIY